MNWDGRKKYFIDLILIMNIYTHSYMNLYHSKSFCNKFCLSNYMIVLLSAKRENFTAIILCDQEC